MTFGISTGTLRWSLMLGTAAVAITADAGAAIASEVEQSAAQNGPVTQNSQSIQNNQAAPVQASAQQVAAAEPNQIKDIIITARRKEEASQNVPVSVVALSQAELTQQAVLNVSDLQTSTPGLVIITDTTGGVPTFAIRGAKADTGTSPTVAIYLDDVPVVTPVAVANMVYDMQSITTLKGPQGTLFGANSTGGAVIFRPNKPTDIFEGYLMAGYGNYNRREVQGMINVPVNKFLEFRFAGEVVRRDGFFKNVSPFALPQSKRMNDDRHESLRGSMRLNFSDTLTNDTVVDWYHYNEQPPAQWTNLLRSNFSFAGVPVNFAAAGIQVLPPFETATSNHPFYFKGTSWGVANTTNWAISPDWSAKLVVGYRRDKLDSSQSQFGTYNYYVSDGLSQFRYRQWTVEPSTTFSWGEGRWSNKFGAFFSRKETFSTEAYSVLDFPFDFTGVPPATVGLINFIFPLQVKTIQNPTFKSAAIYDQMSVKLSDELTARAGIRFTHDSAGIVVSNHTVLDGQGLGPYPNLNIGICDATNASYDNFNPAACTATRSLKSNSTNFLLSMEDHFAPNKMLYASLSSGYLVGGFNNPVPIRQNQIFGPERVTSFEGGLKADWRLGGHPLRTNLSIFYGNYLGQQRKTNFLCPSVNGQPPTCSGYGAVENAGSTRFYGLDADITFKPFDFLTLNATYEFLISKYTNYVAALAEQSIQASMDLTGQQASQAPKHVITAYATLDLPMPVSAGKLSTTLSYFYRSTTTSKDAPTIGGVCADGSSVCITPGSFIPDPTQNYHQYEVLPAFSLFNLSVDWDRIAGSHFSAEFFVKNLFNKLYFTSSNNQALGLGVSSYALGDPRTYGMRLRYNF